MRVVELDNGCVRVDFDLTQHTSVSFERGTALEAGMALLDWLVKFEPSLTQEACSALGARRFLARGRND